MAAPEWRVLAQLLKRLSKTGGRRDTGLFSLEGSRSMERALRNDAPLEEALVSERFTTAGTRREEKILEALEGRRIPVRVAPDGEVAALTGGRGLGDVFGVMRIPEAPVWKRFCEGEGRRLVVVGRDLADPGNTGAVIRSALAAGATGFLAVGNTDPWHPKSVRTSMGSLFALPIRKVETDAEWLEGLGSLGFETFATVCRDGESLPAARPSGNRVAVVMGSEAFGLPEDLIDRMDRRITIPMPEGVDSFSVNAAVAVLAYTLLRER